MKEEVKKSKIDMIINSLIGRISYGMDSEDSIEISYKNNNGVEVIYDDLYDFVSDLLNDVFEVKPDTNMEKKEEYNIRATVNDNGIDVKVRKMDADEMPDDGITYYCEESGQIYTEVELELVEKLYTQSEVDKLLLEERKKTLEEVLKNMSHKNTEHLELNLINIRYIEKELSNFKTK